MDIGSVHLESQELVEALVAVGAVGVTSLLGLLFVRKARAARRRQIEGFDAPAPAAQPSRRRSGRRRGGPDKAETDDEALPQAEALGPDTRHEPTPEPDEVDEVVEEIEPDAGEDPGPTPARPAFGRPGQVLPFPAPEPERERHQKRRDADAPGKADLPQTVPVPAHGLARPSPASPTPPPPKKNALAPGLAKTRSGWVSKLGGLFAGKREIDPALLDEIEKVLLTADIGVRTANKLLEEMRASLSRRELGDPEAIWAHLQRRTLELLSFGAAPLSWGAHHPMVLLIIGVNGSGKTTTIGKLAAKLIADGKRVLVGAGDTFRAAAAEQLEIWANRVGATLVRGKEGADPSSVLFDAVKRAVAEGFDVVIADTAGRLHTKTDLMEELQKVRRVIGKAAPGAPHETWLVIDSTSGQNAIAQAQIFTQAMSVSGIVLTKLDGTAKGGVILGIADQLQIPVRFIGIGERVEDLREFEAAEFVEALFERDTSETTASVTSAR
jgi:fused signal recognition particle receptor